MRKLTLLLLGGLACSSEVGESTRLDVTVTRPSADPIAPASECEVTTYRQPSAGAMHVDVCSELALADEPPTGGTHFGRWASFGQYDAPVPWGFLIHSMEHGAVILAYNCENCDAVLQEFEAIAAERQDPICRDEDVSSRFIIVPMPDLDVPIAALAWEHAYLATCLDSSSLRSWIDEHYGEAPEDFCFPGVDESATGWCP